jgi:hypothetical protein
MGHSAAEALIDAGFTLVPHTLTFITAGVAVRRVGVRAIPFDRRYAALREIREQYPGVVVSGFSALGILGGFRQTVSQSTQLRG